MIKYSIKRICFALLMLMFLIPAGQACAAGRADSKTDMQLVFGSPDQAFNYLLKACKNNDEKLLVDIFGQRYKYLVAATDKIQSKATRTKFYNLAKEARSLEKKSDGKMVLLVGKFAWPFPVPLVKEGKAWRFDSPAGVEEVINRKIGGNELNAIDVCKEYVKAQEEYSQKMKTENGGTVFASKIMSSPGKKDGLYWPADFKAGEEPSPLGPLVAQSQEYLKENTKSGPRPYYGYFFKILTAQGPGASGGRMNYFENDKMTKGFALAAYPADYGVSGIMTFMVSRDGIVYQKDLGKNTRKIAAGITEFNPDKTWTAVKE